MVIELVLHWVEVTSLLGKEPMCTLDPWHQILPLETDLYALWKVNELLGFKCHLSMI